MKDWVVGEESRMIARKGRKKKCPQDSVIDHDGNFPTSKSDGSTRVSRFESLHGVANLTASKKDDSMVAHRKTAPNNNVEEHSLTDTEREIRSVVATILVEWKQKVTSATHQPRKRGFYNADDEIIGLK